MKSQIKIRSLYQLGKDIRKNELPNRARPYNSRY